MRIVVAMAAALSLCGCASGGGLDRVLDYNSIASAPFDVPGDDVYKIFDRPSDNRMAVAPSYAKTAALGAISGATLRTVDTVPRQPFESAALGYLASTGRTCRIVSGELLLRPTWEFKYDCSLPAVVSAPNRRR